MEFLPYSEARDKVAAAVEKGTFFSVEFVKRDGSTRKITARGGVAKFVKGVGMSYDPKVKRVAIVWAPAEHNGADAGYRAIPLDRIVAISA
jgi:hypothetical protein